MIALTGQIDGRTVQRSHFGGFGAEDEDDEGDDGEVSPTSISHIYMPDISLARKEKEQVRGDGRGDCQKQRT